jgi:hypothetical protein
MAWQKKRFRVYWAKLSRARKVGRPALSKAVGVLIIKMFKSNPSWGLPRIVGELRKLGYRGIKVNCGKVQGKLSETAVTNMKSLSG